MAPEAVVFYVLASIALVSAVTVIWSRNVIHSAIYLVLTSCLSALQMYGERLTAYEQRGLGEGRRRRLRLDAPLPTMPAS